MSTYKLGTEFYNRGIGICNYTFVNKEKNSVDIYPGKKIQAPFGGLAQNSKNLQHLQKCLVEFAPDVVINQSPYEIAINDTLLKYSRKSKTLLLACLRNTLFSVKLNIEEYGKSLFYFLPKKFLRYSVIKFLLQILHKFKHAKQLKNILDTHDYFVMFGPPNNEELHYFVGNYKSDKTYLIPNSIPSVCESLPEKENRILYLGRVSHLQKNAQLLTILWEKLVPSIDNWMFDVVGDGDALNDIKKEISTKGFHDMNTYGKQEPSSFYKRSSIFIMTSSFEGFPNVLIEAQSYGSVPVIFNTYPIAEWVIEHGENGFLVEPFNVDQMVEYVNLLANDDELRKNMGLAALENAKRFHISKVGDRWMDLITSNV